MCSLSREAGLSENQHPVRSELPALNRLQSSFVNRLIQDSAIILKTQSIQGGNSTRTNAKQHPLVAAYELGRMWADLCLSLSERRAFPLDRALPDRCNQTSNAFVLAVENAFPELEPGEVRNVVQLWHCDDDWEKISEDENDVISDIVDDITRFGFSEAQRGFYQGLRRVVEYRNECIRNLIVRAIGDESMRFRAFLLGQRLGECVFPPNSILQMIRVEESDTGGLIVNRMRFSFDDFSFAESELGNLRQELWEMRTRSTEAAWDDLRQHAGQLTDRKLSEARHDFLKLHRLILEQLQAVNLDEMPAVQPEIIDPASLAEADSLVATGSAEPMKKDDHSGGDQQDNAASFDGQPPTESWGGYTILEQAVRIPRLAGDRSDELRTVPIKNQSYDLLRLLVLHQGSVSMGQVAEGLRLNTGELTWVQRIKRIVSDVNVLLREKTGLRPDVDVIVVLPDRRPKWKPEATLNLQPFSDRWIMPSHAARETL